MIITCYKNAELEPINRRNDAIKLIAQFDEFGLGSYVADVTHIWFRRKDISNLPHVTDDDIIFTIDHEEDGYIGASMKEAVDYIYRNRKYINAWMRENCSGKEAEHFPLESEMKVIEI